MHKKKLFWGRAAALLLICNSVTALADDLPIPCLEDPVRLELRSKELKEIRDADQTDRKDGFAGRTPEEIKKILMRDTERRIRVGAIFGEGCFSKAEDYANAALVYQHGNSPDHFYQTFLWAKRAVGLGDVSQKWLMAAGVDRYLIHIGHKQLFASQLTRPYDDPCWHIRDFENSFPDTLRKEYLGSSLVDVFARVKKLNEGRDCQTICEEALKPSPQGTVPGFW